MKQNITETIKYIGVDDTDLDLFESQYIIPNGVSYNSYIILDDKVAIMDSVDSRKYEEWAVNVENALQGRTPDFLVVQHMEPDHAGSADRRLDKKCDKDWIGVYDTVKEGIKIFEDAKAKAEAK